MHCTWVYMGKWDILFLINLSSMRRNYNPYIFLHYSLQTIIWPFLIISSTPPTVHFLSVSQNDRFNFCPIFLIIFVHLLHESLALGKTSFSVHVLLREKTNKVLDISFVCNYTLPNDVVLIHHFNYFLP